MITLYQPPPGFGQPSLSPFCAKLETWLRMAGLPFETRRANPVKAPRGKIPYARVDGRLLTDSQLIIDYLTEVRDVALDQGLSAQDRARGHLVRKTLEEATYWVLVYQRWIDEAGWAEWRKVFEPMLPPVIGPFLAGLIRRKVRASLATQGTGRRTPEEIDRLGVADVEAVAAVLGEGPYLLGERPSSYDATAWAFLNTFAEFPVPSKTGDAVRGNPAMTAWLARMKERYYP